jgi:hypothetical protein
MCAGAAVGLACCAYAARLFGGELGWFWCSRAAALGGGHGGALAAGGVVQVLVSPLGREDGEVVCVEEKRGPEVASVVLSGLDLGAVRAKL